MKSVLIWVMGITCLACGQRDHAPFVEEYHTLLDTLDWERFSALPISANMGLEEDLQNLSLEDKVELFRIELSRLTPRETGIGASGPAIGDTTELFPRCFTYDDQPIGTYKKGFEQQGIVAARLMPGTYTVPLFFHVIEDTARSVVVTDAQLAEQVAVLNAVFERIGIKFLFEGAQRYALDKWYRVCSGEEAWADVEYKAMSEALAKDPLRTINVYVNGMPYLGYAKFPWMNAFRTKQDGIIIKNISLPGTQIGADRFEGKTLIHEMGHFLGLWHTFHDDKKLNCNAAAYNGCGIGDDISETPPQKICHFAGCGECNAAGVGCDGCANSRVCDTCLQPGVDAVRNYMGYNKDSCMDHFVQEQYDRLQLNFLTMRIYLGTPIGPT